MRHNELAVVVKNIAAAEALSEYAELRQLNITLRRILREGNP